MAEKIPKFSVSDAYRGIVEDLRLLKRDGQNPNKMTSKQKDAIWKSLSNFS